VEDVRRDCRSIPESRAHLDLHTAGRRKPPGFFSKSKQAIQFRGQFWLPITSARKFSSSALVGLVLRLHSESTANILKPVSANSASISLLAAFSYASVLA